MYIWYIYMYVYIYIYGGVSCKDVVRSKPKGVRGPKRRGSQKGVRVTCMHASPWQVGYASTASVESQLENLSCFRRNLIGSRKSLGCYHRGPFGPFRNCWRRRWYNIYIYICIYMYMCIYTCWQTTTGNWSPAWPRACPRAWQAWRIPGDRRRWCAISYRWH